MNSWRTLIVVVSAAAALAVGVGAQAGSPHEASLQSLLQVAQIEH
jgi:hypothetical protein